MIRFFVQPDLVAILYPTMETRDMILNLGRERWTSTPCMVSFQAIKRNNQTGADICTEIQTSHANIVWIVDNACAAAGADVVASQSGEGEGKGRVRKVTL